jgi:hypothetical protein
MTMVMDAITAGSGDAYPNGSTSTATEPTGSRTSKTAVASNEPSRPGVADRCPAGAYDGAWRAKWRVGAGAHQQA